nr:hypothetical protein [Tanacetum cinerariifolium]
MEQENQQQIAMDEALVLINDQVKIADVAQIYMQQFWEISNFRLTTDKQVPRERNRCPITDSPSLGKLKFMSKGEEHQKYGMSIPDSMMNDEIKNSAYCMTYLALSTNIEKKDGVKKKDARKKKDVVARKKSAITADDNILPDPDEALKLGFDEKDLDHSQKLKGIETLCTAAHLVSDLKTTTKASKLDYRIQQKYQGSSEGAGIIREVPDEPKDIFGSLSSSSSCFDNETKDISSNEEVKSDEHKAEEGKETKEQAGDEQPVDEQAGGEQAKVHALEPAVSNPSSSLTLSFAEYGNQFINKNLDVLINDILKDTTEIKILSMVDVPIHQANPAVQRTHLLILLSALEKKVKVLSKVDHADIIEESIQDNVFNEVKNQLPKLLPKAVSDFVKPRMESTFRDVLQKNPINLFNSSSSSTSIESFTEYELKNMLYNKIQKSGSFNKHEKHLDLYNCLIGLILLDKAITKGEIDPKEDFKPSKDKDQSSSSKAGETPSKSSSTDKSVNAEETVHEPQDDVAPKQENSIWFKQDARPETLDPEWHKVSNADDALEHTWFHELVNADKNPLTFDDLMGSTVDFKKFAMHRLKKDKITKADLEGPAYNLLKGTYRNNIELEYNLEQCYLALLDKLDWANPEGDISPFDLSKPLPLQDYQGRLILPVNFFFNNDLEYLKTGNKERNYASSLTKTAMMSVNKLFGYGYLNEIVIQRADQKEYTFREANFSRLHLNDIEGMFPLYVKHKLHNLIDDDIVDLMIALRIFTRSIVVKRRIEDVQLGVERY